MKRLLPRLLLLACLAASARAAPFELTDDFVAYMKSVLNPFEFGQRADGRLYPYSTRYGRRVGYGLPVTDKSLFARGQTKAEAEDQLRAGLLATVPRLEAHLAAHFPATPWRSLPRPAQEVLLDHAFTEGVAQLPAALCAAVLRGDWPAVIHGHLYVRAADGWPDYVKNAAFGRRWIYGPASSQLAPRRE
jgi:hypothetical protein